jgi:hypothetical protein
MGVVRGVGSRPRSRSRCGTRSNCRRRSRSRRRSATTRRRLDSNRHRRSCFEEVERGTCSLRWLVGIEPEVIQRAPANSVGILILRKRFCLPGYGGRGLIDRSAAISLVIKSAVVWPARFLRRRVKSDVTNINSRSYRQPGRLDSTTQAHVIEGILIVPDSSRRIGYFLADEPDAVVSRIGLDPVHCLRPTRPLSQAVCAP